MKNHYPLILVLIFASIILSIRINKPFIGHHDFNSSFFSIIARNISQYSVLDTKLGQVLNTGFVNPINFSFYTHNVPLYSWVLAVDFKLFGVGESQARLLSVIFTIAILLLIFVIAANIYSQMTAYLASLFFTLSAIVIYFSSNVFPDLQGIFLTLSAYLMFLFWLDRNKTKYFLTYLVLSFLSYLTIWGSYFITPFIIIYYLLFHKGKPRTVVYLFTLPVACFGLFLIFNFILQRETFFDDIKNSFLSRTNIVDSVYSVSIGSYIRQEISIFIAYYSKITTFLVLLWFLNFFKGVLLKSFDKNHLKLLVLFLWGISYIVFFRQASYIHDYFLIYLSPFVAIAAASMVNSIYQISSVNRLLKNSILIILLTLFPIIQFLSVKNFALALINSNNNKPGYELGKFLYEKTGKEDKIVVLSREFGSYFDVFAKFYSDRNLSFADLQFKDYEHLKQNYTYAVIIEGRTIDKELKELLLTKSQYASTKNLFTIVKM